MAQIQQGAEVARAIDAETTARAGALRAAGVVPTLGIVRASSRDDCVSYARSIRKRCEAQGIDVVERVLPDDAIEADVLGAIAVFANDDAVRGVVVCQPLPEGVSKEAVVGPFPPK